MNMPSFKKLTFLFFLSLTLLACDDSKENVNSQTNNGENLGTDNGENLGTDNEIKDSTNISQIVPRFEFSGGSSSAQNINPEEFCDIYLSADAFIYGTITSIAWVEEPFVVLDLETGAPSPDMFAESVDQCKGLSPALKIDVEVNEFFSGYGLEKPKMVALYIGYERAKYMQPEPVPNFNWTSGRPRISDSTVTWKSRNCEEDQTCSLNVGHQLGFFTNSYIYQNENEIWYLMEYFFWANSLSYGVNGESKYYDNLKNKSSLEDIQNAADNCRGWTSEIVAYRRGDDRQYNVINFSLPHCEIK